MTSPIDFMEDFKRIALETSKQYLNYKFTIPFNSVPGIVKNTASDLTYGNQNLSISGLSQFKPMKGQGTNGFGLGTIPLGTLTFNQGINVAIYLYVESISSPYTFF